MINIEKKKNLNFCAKELYQFVADVESYSKFLPWCKSSVIKRNDKSYFIAKLEMEYLLFSGSFDSKVTLFPEENKIHSLGIKGPFNFLETTWVFDEYDHGTLVSINLEMDLKNKTLEQLLSSKIEIMIDKAIKYFEKNINSLTYR